MLFPKTWELASQAQRIKIAQRLRCSERIQ